MELDIVLTVTSIAVAGVTSIVGIWIERDPTRTKKIAVALSTLIVMASFVSIVQSYVDEQAKQKMEADLARMLVMLNQIASQEGAEENSELQNLIKSELSVQSRNNPKVINKVAQRISDSGGDVSKTLGTYLPKAEIESLSRRGRLTVKKTIGKRDGKTIGKIKKITQKVKTGIKTIGASKPAPQLTVQSQTKRSTSSSTPASKDVLKISPQQKSATKRVGQPVKRNTANTQTQNKRSPQGIKTQAKRQAQSAKNDVKNKVNNTKNNAKKQLKDKANQAKKKAQKKLQNKLNNLF